MRYFLLLLLPVTLAHTALADGPMLRVNVDAAQIQVTENGEKRVIATVPQGTQLWAFESKDDFFLVRDAGTGTKGWIWSRHVTEVIPQPAALADYEAALTEIDTVEQLVADGDQAKARAIAERLLQTALKALGENHPRTAAAYSRLGAYFVLAEDLAAAEKFLQTSLATYRKILGNERTETTTGLYLLGDVYRRLGEYAKAETLLRECHELESKLLDAEDPDALLTVNLLGCVYLDQENYDQAEPLFQECLRIRTKVLGREHTETLLSLANLAQLYRNQGKNEQAEPLLRELLQLRKNTLGDEHADTLYCQNELAACYHYLAAYDKAEPLYQECLRVRTETLGEQHAHTLLTMNNLGAFYRDRGDYAQSAPLLEKVLGIRRSVLGDEHLDTATSLIDLASCCLNMGQNEKAELLYKECLAIRMKALGEEHEDTAWTLFHLAAVYRNRGVYEKALLLLQQSLAILTKIHGPQHASTASAEIQLASLYVAMADSAQAEPILRRNLEVRQALFGDNHVDTAETLCYLGSAYDSLGEYAKAEPLLTRGVEIASKLLGESHPYTGDYINMLGMLYHSMGDYSRAESFYQRSLEVRSRAFGDDHGAVAALLNNIAVLHQDQKDYEKAEAVSLKSLGIYEKTLGKDHPDTGNSLSNLGAIYIRTGRYAEARPLLERALNIFRNRFKDDNLYAAGSLRNLAKLNHRTGQFQEAETQYTQSIQQYQKLLGQDHPTTTSTTNALAELQLAMGAHAKAIATQDVAMQSARRHLCTVLPALTEPQRQKYLAYSYIDEFANALSLGLECQSDRRAANLSAGWVLNGKAAGAEALAEAALLSSEEAAPLVKELRSVRDQIAKIALRDAAAIDSATRERLAGLETRQQQLSQQIAEFSLGLQTGNPWVTTGALMSEIPFNSVLVNIARIRRRDFQSYDDKTMWLPTRYVAWIVPSAGSDAVKIVDLGESAPIDALIAELRAQIQKDFERIRKGESNEVQVTEQLRTTTLELSKRVLAPLEASLTGVEEIILSPDGELWTLPWDALLTQDGSYLIEKYRTRYVISGRELVRKTQARQLVGDPAIFADANFSLSRENVLNAETEIKSELRSFKNAFFPQLKSSAAEAVNIRPSIDGYTRKVSKMFLADECQEATFKNLHRPRVLVVSTHGFVENPGKPEQGQAAIATYDNPLLRCGLAFAGANNRNQEAEEGKEDGILTGLEIVGIDLRGTELVVLSACQTGLGDIQDGEGVAGLRHAFQLAGASAVISSLWEVEDGATARLINAFFGNLAKGQSKSEALRQAQLSQIQSRRDRFGAAHPFFWSAFTLTGK